MSSCTLGCKTRPGPVAWPDDSLMPTSPPTKARAIEDINVQDRRSIPRSCRTLGAAIWSTTNLPTTVRSTLMNYQFIGYEPREAPYRQRAKFLEFKPGLHLYLNRMIATGRREGRPRRQRTSSAAWAPPDRRTHGAIGQGRSAPRTPESEQRRSSSGLSTFRKRIDAVNLSR